MLKKTKKFKYKSFFNCMLKNNIVNIILKNEQNSTKTNNPFKNEWMQTLKLNEHINKNI